MTETTFLRPWRGDAILAVALVGTLGAIWAMRNWGDLALLRLPDSDDSMRLQQVRDWLGGQRWADVRQYRVGVPGGVAMHWSRLPDLPIAAIILAATPLLGVAAAEIAAIILVPLLYFVAVLMLVGAIARQFGGAAIARTAMLVAALAYPATSLFMPGRIDHHSAQLALLAAAVHGMVARSTKMRGVAVGAAMVASVAIGLEMLPVIAATGGWAVAEWLRRSRGADARLAGIGGGVALCGVAAAGLIPVTSPLDLCDAVNPALRWVIVAFGFAAQMLGTFASRIPAPRWLMAAIVGAILIGFAFALAPQCVSGPYGAVDPMLRRLWLANVAEATPLPRASFGVSLSYAGVMIVGLIATVAQARRHGGDWWALVALLAVALMVTFVQVRGAYVGALLAAPGLAAMIAAARARGTAPLAAAWLASAGIFYPIVAALGPRAADHPTPAVEDCTEPTELAALARLPAGRIVAPIDIGAFAVSATHHASLAAPYHRNNAANAAMYRFFLGSERAARAVAARDRLTYVAWCAGAFEEIDLDRDAAPDALIRRIRADKPPAWLRPVKPGRLRVWRIEG